MGRPLYLGKAIGIFLNTFRPITSVVETTWPVAENQPVVNFSILSKASWTAVNTLKVDLEFSGASKRSLLGSCCHLLGEAARQTARIPYVPHCFPPRYSHGARFFPLAFRIQPQVPPAATAAVVWKVDVESVSCVPGLGANDTLHVAARRRCPPPAPYLSLELPPRRRSSRPH